MAVRRPKPGCRIFAQFSLRNRYTDATVAMQPFPGLAWHQIYLTIRDDRGRKETPLSRPATCRVILGATSERNLQTASIIVSEIRLRHAKHTLSGGRKWKMLAVGCLSPFSDRLQVYSAWADIPPFGRDLATWPAYPDGGDFARPHPGSTSGSKSSSSASSCVDPASSAWR